MRNTPIERKLIDETIADFHITDFAKATIREVKAIAANAEAASGVEFIKMEMGVPGLPPSAVGVNINRKTFCATFSNHFVSFLELLTQNELRKFIRFSGLSKHLSKAIKKHLKSYILPIFV